MTSRRAPLANVPNATNSPYRPHAAAATKRPRSHASEQRDAAYTGQPPAKKQFLEENDTEARRQVLLKKAGQTQTSAAQRKLEAARDVRSSHKPIDRPQKVAQDNYDTIRQWQKHYRKVFPQYVFYFENIPADARARATKQILALGAREEKFFSKSVTHVVTTRQIPADQPVSSSIDSRTTSSNAAASQDESGQLRTINPSLLDRSTEPQVARTRLALELAAARKPGISSAQGIFQDPETRTRSSHNGDILIKAREMGMKIWALEKLERILNTMFNTDTGEQPPAYNTRGSTAVNASKARGADLSQLLKNEKVNGPADRDLAVSTKDMAHFRGYYVYVHCMNEKYRPVIMRDYPKVPTKEDGKWPQFRLTAPGRCPFVEDPAHLRKLQMQDQQKTTQQRTEKAASTAPRTRSASAAFEAAKQLAPKAEQRRALTENNNIARRGSVTEESTDTLLAKPLDPPKLIPAKRREPDGIPPLFGSAQASLRAMPRYAGGEPIASGVQPSNITSAIKSQMISSTAAAPGARAGTSKELHQLSRKVLEKNSAPNSTNSSYMTDIRAAINGDRAPPTRAAKRKAQETITGGKGDAEDSEKQSSRRVIISRSKKSMEKEPKPGYCENCREKFDDFDTHIVGRKHRKFATTPDNWTELDNLLSELTRPYL
ncbi:BRCT domain-containing protein [Macrophomina phaseolina MS6]|uniref:BRCT domain-containing protein n=1 Tax=Macrophomina phaseolina (strain MS6) TaxID=1126212 RepID=K2QPK4_MACPH|nr:BRCT domain-containing protein [Macrophomina phaseolina MS6]